MLECRDRQVALLHNTHSGIVRAGWPAGWLQPGRPSDLLAHRDYTHSLLFVGIVSLPDSDGSLANNAVLSEAKPRRFCVIEK